MTIAVEFKRKEIDFVNIRPGGERRPGAGADEAGGRRQRPFHPPLREQRQQPAIFHNPVLTRRVTLMDSRGWSQAPGFDELAAAYPAEGGGIEGYAVAHCKMDATGALNHCMIAKETPIGHGFGKAAVALAPRFRVSAAVMASAPKGAPVEVDVPIRFPPAAEASDHTVRAPVWAAGYDLPSSCATSTRRDRGRPAPAPGEVPNRGRRRADRLRDRTHQPGRHGL